LNHSNKQKPEVPNGLIVVSGPSRGGKSRWAEHLLSSQETVIYVATSAQRSNDPSWDERMREHRERRPVHWQLREPGSKLAECIRKEEANHPLLIDALGGFTAGLLDHDDLQWEQETGALIESLLTRTRPTVVVVEETGWGIVPATKIGGLFRDRQGWLAQRLEQQATDSWLVVQGRALNLTQLGILVP
jgi:adenosylcobinamide kinase/adenosylcobinamide-phosphate guanylyltransferase